MTDSTKELGDLAEDCALAFLEEQGLSFVERNFLCKVGEIDLIMRDNEFLVFVEVRYRKNKEVNSGLESVTKAKQRRIIGTAKRYLLQNDLYDNTECRFDVVSMDDELVWVKDAFWEKW